jgi:hypothetical protein
LRGRLIDIIWVKATGNVWAHTEECCGEFVRFCSCLFTKSRTLFIAHKGGLWRPL